MAVTAAGRHAPAAGMRVFANFILHFCKSFVFCLGLGNAGMRVAGSFPASRRLPGGNSHALPLVFHCAPVRVSQGVI